MSRSVFSSALARVVVIGIVVSGLHLDPVPTESSAAQTWDETRFVELVMEVIGNPAQMIQGGCFDIWSDEGPSQPLYVCDDIDVSQYPDIDLGNYADGGPVELIAIPDLNPNPGTIWADAGTQGPRLFIQELWFPEGYAPYVQCSTDQGQCDLLEVHTRVGASVTFRYESTGQASTTLPAGDGVADAFRTVSPSSAGPEPGAATSSTGCEIVELRPGYPGYRGVVAGLVGRSDTACLADLEALDPTFSKAAEDAANLQVATQIGVGGYPQLWTWEAWMAVGAERGFGFICYGCLASAEPPAVPVGPVAEGSINDPRLALSIRESQPIFAYRFLSAHGVLYGYGVSDQALRIIASSVWDGYPNAVQLIETAERLLATYHGIEGYEELGGGFRYTFPRIVCQSGHVAVPLSANIQDQDGLFELAVLAVAQSYLGDLSEASKMGIVPGFELTVDAWRREGPGSFARLADYVASSQGISCPP